MDKRTYSTAKRITAMLNCSVLIFVVYSLFDLSLFGRCSTFLIGSDFAFRLLSLSLFAEDPFSLDLARSYPNRTCESAEVIQRTKGCPSSNDQLGRILWKRPVRNFRNILGGYP